MLHGISGAILIMTTPPLPAAEPADMHSPIHLRVEPTKAGVQLRVVGSSPVTCLARYELHVIAAMGGNRSVQSGSARLQANREITLVTTGFGGKIDDGWSATLRVEACDGRRYEEVKRGSR